MLIQESSGQPWNTGTANWTQPLQCDRSTITLIKLNILTTTVATLKY